MVVEHVLTVRISLLSAGWTELGIRLISILGLRVHVTTIQKYSTPQFNPPSWCRGHPFGYR
jgi:hypothetical protein